MDDRTQSFIIRAAKETDLSFIFSTWLRSFYHSADFTKDIDKEIYYQYHQEVIKRIFGRLPRILVACDVQEPETIFGYIVAEGPVLHFAYVKRPFRAAGLATALLNALEPPKFVSHLTKHGKKFLEKNPNVRYSPYFT
jgi:hypothetical protein